MSAPAGLPIVVVVDGQMVCPVCGVKDRIVMHETGFRVAALSLVGDDLVSDAGDGDWETSKYVCGACQKEVDLGRPIDYEN